MHVAIRAEALLPVAGQSPLSEHHEKGQYVSSPPRTTEARNARRSRASWFATAKITRFRTVPLNGSRFGWVAFDFCAGLGCVCLASSPVMRYAGSGSPSSVLEVSLWGLLFGLCVSFFTRMSFFGRPSVAVHPGPEYMRLVKDVTISALLVGGLLVTLGRGPTSQVAMETVICLTLGVMVIGRVAWKRKRLSHRRRGDSLRNFAIAGSGREACEVRDYLLSLTYAGYHFKGFIALDGESTVPADGEHQVLGPLEGIMPLARSMFVDEIFFLRQTSPASLKDVLKAAAAAEIDIRVIPGMTETLRARSDVHYIGDLPTVVVLECNTHEMAKLGKRLIDVVGAAGALVMLMPLVLFLATWIKIDSDGPAFYTSERVGLKGRIFRCIKLRTMVRNAHAMRGQLNHLNERDGILFKISKDPRITRIGAVLRKYSLDELPQFWNVLRGDMSLVGPRPPIFSEVELYSIDQFCRLEVPPGITGLWQVEARDDPSFESYIEFDRRYVNDWSIWLDMKILFRTLEVVVRGTGV